MVVRLSDSLPSTGGDLTVTGYNFGERIEDVTAMLTPRPGAPPGQVAFLLEPGRVRVLPYRLPIAPNVP